MSEKTYILNVYNTMTGEFELVQVTKEVFQTYRRTKWHIEDSTERFYKHETQMSSLIGGENDGYGSMNLLIMTTPLKIRQLRRWCASPCVIFWICSRRRIMS